jgi:curved DNA-binding protein
MAEDYYAVLGVPRDASAQDIKKAFRAIARECHPDVAGADPVKEQRFKEAKEAYETLADDVARARYDRRHERRASGGSGSFREAFYRRAAGAPPDPGNPSQQRTKRRVNDPGNNLDLDDLFNDFGFGRGAGRQKGPGRPRPSEEPPRGNSRGSSERAWGPSPQPGRDVHIDLDVPDHIARDGGIVTAVYYRMQRSESWRPGAPDPGIARIQDLADVRLLPGTRNGEVLHEKGKGDAGSFGGPYGDLIVRVRIVASAPSDRARRGPEPAPEPAAEAAADGDQRVDISIAEAILGARIEVPTPHGPVWVAVPPGTSSDARMRLKGKGPISADGAAADLYVRVRIVVPRAVDAESRELIERFAALNPTVR